MDAEPELNQPPYEIAAEAQDDLFEIWSRIAEDSVSLADRIEAEFHDLFSALARMPRQGHSRKALTDRPVLFFSMYSFLVIYVSGYESDSDHGGSWR